MKEKTVYFCTECGNESPKWAGRCPSCGAWNAMVEQRAEKAKHPSGANRSIPHNVKVTNITDIDTSDEIRFSTGMGELDRVLGGGAVKGSLVLVGGAPGIGKSTLMLQICQQLGMQNKVLYVSGEESIHQLKMRAKRLGVDSANLFVVSETRLSDILEAVEREQPDVLIIDSIQTLYNEELDSPAGGVGQVKDCTMALMNLAKGQGITVFVIGHVNKEGSIAGPKVLEHMVDCVLYFEGDRHMTYRILRAAKNRFGATNEIGVFEMLNEGLKEVENPSEMLLSGRPQDAPGTCVTCVMEGARPVLAEVQALVSSASGVRPLRQSNGFDYNRANMLLAGLFLASCFISISIGTSVGTIVALTPIAAGIAHSTGASVPFIVGIVAGGSFFGDNLSFISDTTVAATRTMECKMSDKFKVNSFIAIPAAMVVLTLYLFMGAGINVPSHLPDVNFIKVLPYLVVLVTAAFGLNVLVVLTIGIALTGIIGITDGTYDLFGWLHGMGQGITGMGELIIITMMAGGLLEIIRMNGGIDYIIERLTAHISGKRGAELTIAFLVSFVNVCTANNTVAILTVGGIAKQVSRQFGIDNRKAASILDTFSCCVQGIIPYGAQLLMAAGLAKINPVNILPYVYYPLVLAVSAICAILFRFPKRYS